LRITHKFPTSGNYTVKVVATDGVMRSSEATKTVTVGNATASAGAMTYPVQSPPPPPPPPVIPSSPEGPVVFIYSPPTVSTGQSFEVEELAMARSGTIESYEWDWTNIGSNFSETGGAMSSDNALRGSSTNPGTIWFRLTVTDSNGNSSTAYSSTEVVFVSPPPVPNEAPEAKIIPPTTKIQKTEIWIGEESTDTDGGKITSWEWTFLAGCTPVSGFSTTNGDGGKVKFDHPGVYTITLKVTDDGGATNGTTGGPLSDTVTETIVIENLLPIADFTWMDKAQQGEDITITNFSTDQDGTITSVVWEFTPDPNVVEPMSDTGGKVYFDTPGTYKLKLTVTDSDGDTATVEKTIVIEPAVPIAQVDDVPTEKKQNRTIEFDGTKSYSSAR